MNQMSLRVIRIDNFDEAAKQSSVTFRTNKNVEFTCFVDGSTFSSDEITDSIEFYWLASDNFDYDTAMTSNQQKEKSMKCLSEWSYFCKGQIKYVEDQIAYVDCGGVLIPFDGIGGDERLIGGWLGFPVERLEVEKS